MMDAEAVTTKIINTYYSDSRALEDCDLVILGIMLLVTYTSCMKKYSMWTCFFVGVTNTNRHNVFITLLSSHKFQHTAS